ncbi:UDP-glucose 4-epimerase GalE [Cytobacillus sp. Hz8]|uniref:UDP-glucose 4-epimerase GalE n=1 Tax=Cytobacillus sp. Hz8 TaxID=3347168 RepID=UPI0035DAD0CB
MAVLVTGGAGYIGSHTCLELLQAGCDIVVIDNFMNSSVEVVHRIRKLSGENFQFYNMNLLDRDHLEQIFQKNKIEACIHFAGVKAVGESVRFPLLYYKQNLFSTINLCRVMQKYGVKNLIFSSSATVYGSPEKSPITEDHVLHATNPYGRTKWMIEELLKDLSLSDQDWSITILRYFNPIGAHESGEIGEDPKGMPNNLMPFVTRVAAGEYPMLEIFGDQYPTKDGTCIRDYIHVVDLACGHLKALEKTISARGVDIYNLGTGQGYSVLELVNTFEAVTGMEIPYQISKPRAGDVAICYADVTKAERELGWRAVRGIEEMCRDSWNWQSKNPIGYCSEVKTL